MCDYHQLSAADCAPADENIVEESGHSSDGDAGEDLDAFRLQGSGSRVQGSGPAYRKSVPPYQKIGQGYISPKPSTEPGNPNSVKFQNLEDGGLYRSLVAGTGTITVKMMVSGGAPLFKARTHRGRIC